MREGKALFPFSLLRFSPPPLPSPSFFVPATQAKESVAAEIYNSCTIQFLGFLGVLHSFSPWSVMFSKMLVLYICSSTLMVFLLSQAYNPVETMAISSQVWNSQNYK